MDNLLEIILPLIFFAIYFASQFFGKKSEEENAPGEPASDDLKKVRDELRRKIQERREQSQSPQQSTRQQEAPAKSDNSRGGAILRESQPRRGMVERRTSPSQARETAGEAPIFRRDMSIERDLEVQMEEVRRTQEKAEAARRETRQRMASVARASAAARSPASYRQFLREALKDPESLQKSFVLHEVFGTPIGMRRENQMRPSWDL